MNSSRFANAAGAAIICTAALWQGSAGAEFVIDTSGCDAAQKTELASLPGELNSAFEEIENYLEEWGAWPPYRSWFGPTEKLLVHSTYREIRRVRKHDRLVIKCGERATVSAEKKPDSRLVYEVRLKPGDRSASALELVVLALAEALLPDSSVSAQPLPLTLTLVGKKPGEPSQYQPSVYAYFFASALDWSKHRNEQQALIYAINRRLTRLRQHFQEAVPECTFGERAMPDKLGYTTINFQCWAIRTDDRSTNLHVENRFSSDLRHVIMDKNYVQPYIVMNAANGWTNQTLLSVYASDLFLLQYASAKETAGVAGLPFSTASLPATLPGKFTRLNVTNTQTRRTITEVSPSLLFGDKATDWYDPGSDEFRRILATPNVRSTNRIIDEFNTLKGTRYCISRIVAQISSGRQNLNIHIEVGESGGMPATACTPSTTSPL